MRGRMSKNSLKSKLSMILLTVIGSTIFFFFLAVLLAPLFFHLSHKELISLADDFSSPVGIEVLKFIQGFNTIGAFMIPGIIAAYLLSTNPATFIGADSFPRKYGLTLILLIIVALSGMVISDTLYNLTTSISFPSPLQSVEQYFKNMDKAYQEQLEAFLKMNSLIDFVEIFVIVAVLPAVCEETLFRGVLQPVMGKAVKNDHLGIIIIAFLFALLHRQFYSFLSIMALGIVLGYLRYWSGSLWVPVIMHLINNGAWTIAIYFFDRNIDRINEISFTETYCLWPGLLIFILSLVGLYKVLRSQ